MLNCEKVLTLIAKMCNFALVNDH